ncbi:hypothetical protein JCM10207_005942 [Rhodosporidiobolus poonsookiae]
MSSSPIVLRGSSEEAGEEPELGTESLDLTGFDDEDELYLTPGASSMRRPNLKRLSGSFNSFRSTPTTTPTRGDKSWFSLSSISFGSFTSPSTFVAEWERAGTGVDRVLLETVRKDGRKTLVVRMWDQGTTLSADPTSGASSIRITIDVSTVDRCQSSAGGTSLFFNLSRPPLFERFPSHAPGSLKPLPEQVSAFDETHEQVAGYTSQTLRIKLRSRIEASAFFREVESIGLPRIIAVKVETDGSTRYGALALAKLQSWLAHLPLPLAFQVQKLLQSSLVDPIELLQLRDLVDELAASSDTVRAERVLVLFADSLAALELEEDEAIILTSDSSEESNEDASPSQPRRKRQKSELPTSELSSSSDDEQAVEPALPFFRGRSLRYACELSVDDLRRRLRSAIRQGGRHLLDAASSKHLLRQVTITPTRILLSGPVLSDSNSIIRAYGHPNHFLSVSVGAEDDSRLREKDRDLLASRYKTLFRDGVDIGGRTFSFLAFSSSALKSATAFFMTPFERDGVPVSPQLIHNEIGNFSGTATGVIPAKYSARIAQAFSTSKPTLSLRPDQILVIDDITSPSGSCFSDGVGLISTALAAEVVKALKIQVKDGQKGPTCFQFRMGGAKGMLQVDPSLEGSVVALRPSGIKFDSHSRTLEIAGIFAAGQAYLNRPLIKLLEDLGVEPISFLKLQSTAVSRIRKSRSTLRSAVKLVQDWSLAPSTHFASTLDYLQQHDSVATLVFANPFVKHCLDAAVVNALREIKHSGRIPLPGCHNLVGVLDVEGVLQEGEVFACIEREDGVEYVEGTIAISRSPTNHPGDCRLVRAVGALPPGVGKRIRGLRNCVVFSQKGERSLPSMLAGGDLDGDVYLLLTESSGLVPAPDCIATPAAYDASPTVKLDRDVTVSDTADFFFEYIVRDRTGLVATRQLHLADAYPQGLHHPDCLRLAQLHSDCVDAAKSGTFVAGDEVPKPPERGWPDWLTNDDPSSYRSPKALGQLYRAIGEDLVASFKPTPAAAFSSPKDSLDPARALTSALSALSLPSLPSSRLPRPSSALITTFRALLASFSTELWKLAALSSSAGPRLANGRPARVTEEELFLSVSLGARRLDRTDKTALSRRREQVGELFALVRRVIRRGGVEEGDEPTTRQAVGNAWAAWVAAVEESEDRAKRAQARRGGAGAAAPAVGVCSWGWLAMGVLVEQLGALEKEQVEVIVLD